jgi:hypothetical protein
VNFWTAGNSQRIRLSGTLSRQQAFGERNGCGRSSAAVAFERIDKSLYYFTKLDPSTTQGYERCLQNSVGYSMLFRVLLISMCILAEPGLIQDTRMDVCI